MPKIRRKSIENDFLLIFFCMQSEGAAQSSILMILRHPLNGLGFSYIGSRPSYMRLSSPYTWPQFRIGIVHFFVASNVDKYRAFKRAVSLGNTLL